jgi:hypothetical protein
MGGGSSIAAVKWQQDHKHLHRCNSSSVSLTLPLEVRHKFRRGGACLIVFRAFPLQFECKQGHRKPQRSRSSSLSSAHQVITKRFDSVNSSPPLCPTPPTCSSQTLSTVDRIKHACPPPQRQHSVSVRQLLYWFVTKAHPCGCAAAGLLAKTYRAQVAALRGSRAGALAHSCTGVQQCGADQCTQCLQPLALRVSINCLSGSHWLTSNRLPAGSAVV